GAGGSRTTATTPGRATGMAVGAGAGGSHTRKSAHLRGALVDLLRQGVGTARAFWNSPREGAEEVMGRFRQTAAPSRGGDDGHAGLGIDRRVLAGERGRGRRFPSSTGAS